MKTLIQQLAIITFAIFMAACSSSNAGPIPLDVTKGDMRTQFGDRMKVVRVTAVVDSVTVTGIMVDRGNCKNVSGRGVSRLPAQLGFGQSFEFMMPANCNVREVVIQTNLMPITASFNQ